MWPGLRDACLIALLTAATIAGPAAAADDTVAHGQYMTRAADCMPCHTQPGGTPFAGGLQIGTPFGSLSSPNITPDPDTGIGRWSDDDFDRALHEGLGHSGEYLYPVMPYPSYTKMTREDVLAIKAYLFTLKPVFAPRAPSAMDFPFNIRAGLFIWRELFFRPGVYEYKPDHSAEWNRGAYLVEGPGHCGACHSPRNLMGGTEVSESLAGGAVQDWLAPNISSDPLDGIGDKSLPDIVTFLRSGADKAMGVAFGPMAEVVHESLHYLTDEDVRAIAVFLKEGPERQNIVAASSATAADLRAGQHLYLANCAECHQDNGRGIPGAVPNLAGNAAVTADQPRDIIVAVLQGLQGTGGYGQMPSFAGALSDKNIADIANYIRAGWRNKAPANATPTMVASLRAVANVGAAGSEAARDFDCPRVGSGTISNVIADPAQANFIAGGDPSEVGSRIDELISSLRTQQPGISDAALTNTVNAAFCPAVANAQGLSNAQKRARLMQLNERVQQDIATYVAPPEGHVVATVRLRPSLAQLLANQAASRHLSPAEYMAQVLGREAGGK